MKPEEIKAARKEKKMTQTKLALAVGVSVQSVRLWETGGNKPGPENLEKLQEVLGVK